MTRKLFLLAGTFLSLSVLLAFTYKAADFSGTWNLDESASELGQFGTRGAASKITVTQAESTMKLAKTSQGFDGNTVENTETYTVGKESENAGIFNSKKFGTMNWDGDQAFKIVFTIKMEFQGQSMELTGNEKWELSADGKTLTLSVNMTTPQGEINTKAVYKKG